MMTCSRRFALVLAALALSSTAAATYDVWLYWEQVTLTLHLGGKPQTRVQVAATTSMRGELSYLTGLHLTMGRTRIPCPSQLIDDLPFPQLGTLKLVYSSHQGQFDSSGAFELRFSFGLEAPAASRYSEARLLFKAGKPVGRTFAIPIEHGGWRYQDTKP